MNVVVMYFSRTGNSKRVAEKIAQKTNGRTVCITDELNWKGPGGFAKGGFYAAKWQTTHAVLTPAVNFDEYDKIVIVGPVWAGNPAPAVYSLIMEEMSNYLDKIFLVLTCGGMNMPVLSKIENKLGQIPFKSVIAKFRDDENEAIMQIAQEIA